MNIIKKIKAAATAVKNGFKSVFTAVGSSAKRGITTIRTRVAMSRMVLANARGENYVDSGVKILIAVVIGALLLAGLYSLFGDTIMPTVTTKVEEMFEFKG
ncbi:MAG: hypothetical protein J6N15_01140 [Ruminiclostridium sp.]|nr:hypothetical protein [Ruminiclostridium sp.]